MPDDERLLREAIALAAESRAAGNHPFGALLADPARAQALAAAGRARFERDFAEAPVLAQWREFLHKVQR